MFSGLSLNFGSDSSQDVTNETTFPAKRVHCNNLRKKYTYDFGMAQFNKVSVQMHRVLLSSVKINSFPEWPDGQMVCSILAVCNNKHLPNAKHFAKYSLNALTFFGNDIKNLPKWQYFVKSGHSNYYLSFSYNYGKRHQTNITGIGQWIHLRLPSCGPRVRSPCTTSMLFQFLFELRLEMDRNKQKEA